MKIKLRNLISGLAVLALVSVFFYGGIDGASNTDNSFKTVICGNTVQKIDNRLIVSREGKELWASPKDWKVREVLTADLNDDDRDEIIFTLEKHGSFGKYKPLWTSDIKLISSSHLFVYGFFGNDNSKFAPIWCSSAAKRPILSIKAASPVFPNPNSENSERLLNSDKVYFEISDRADILTLRDLRPLLTGKSEYQRKNLWYWDGFGFTLAE